MRAIKASLLITSVLGLTACPPTGQIFGEHIDGLKDDNGYLLGECTTNINPVTGRPAFYIIPKTRAKEFWMNNNLPNGTLYYFCDGDKAYLPKDCEGNSLTTPQIRKYWRKHNLTIGTIKFDCSTGVPRVPQDK